MNNLTLFNYSYLCMNKFIFSFTLKNYFVNFSKMVADTGLKFSAYTNILTSYRMVYHTLL